MSSFNSEYFQKINKVLLFIILILIIIFATVYFYFLKVTTSSKLPPRLQKFINKFGNYQITKIRLCKQELSPFFKSLFQYATLGKIKKEYETLGSYDHPYLILSIINPNNKNEKEKQIIFEKISVTVLRELKPNEILDRTQEYKFDPEVNPKPLKVDTTCFGEIKGIPDLTINEFLSQSLKELQTEFLQYDCREKHCGWFLKRSIVDSNLIPETEKDAVINFLNIEKSKLYLKDYPKTANLINSLVNIIKIREYLTQSK